MLLSALTPSDIDVEILDERAQVHCFDDRVDLVAVTALTADAPRVYEIAAEYRRRGVPTIVGGMHATVMPDEAALHFDAVVIGEAEYLWDQILTDVRNGQLRRRYQADQFHALAGLPHPRRDLLDPADYLTVNVIQTTRGCPHRCTFCSISTTAGLKFRCRPVSDVIEEIEAATPYGRFFGFVDDNINGHPRYALELCRAMKNCGIHWYGDTTVLIADNEPLLDAAAASGCKILLIGFESLSQTTLDKLHKRFNHANKFVEAIRRIHARGIGVIGSFILGLDGDTLDEGQRILEFAHEAALDLVQISILTPYPGTQLFEDYNKTGRLLTLDWSAYDTTRGNIVFVPEQMTGQQLQDLYFETYERVYSFSSIVSRLARSRNYPGFFVPYNFRQRTKVAAAKRRRVIVASDTRASDARPA